MQAEELQAPGAPAAEVSSRIDTVAVILADDPIMSEQLQPLLDALASHRTPTHVEGIVDEQWHPIDTSPRRSWRELRVGLQLANRDGAVPEDEIERFNRTIADFAATVNAVSQREAPSAAAARARDLDRFCAETDIEVAVNVVGQFGATFAIPRVKSLAMENGISETASGDLVLYGHDGQPVFTVRKLDDGRAKPSAHLLHGPHVCARPSERRRRAEGFRGDGARGNALRRVARRTARRRQPPSPLRRRPRLHPPLPREDRPRHGSAGDSRGRRAGPAPILVKGSDPFPG